MEDESWRDEYVLNEEGLQYYGSRYHVGGMDWYYGQVRFYSYFVAVYFVENDLFLVELKFKE